jgi:superfamily II DNA or RNA helicase
MVIVDEAHSVRTDIQEGLSAKIRNRRKNGKEILLSSTLLTAIRQSADVNVIPLGKEHHWMISDSMAVIEACRKAYKVLFLSGTPLVNNPFDIANFLSLAEGTPIAKKREFIEDIMDRVDDVKQYFLFHEDNKEGFPKVNETTWEIEVDDKTYPMICKAKEQNEMFEKEVFYVGDRMCSNAGVPFKVNAIKDYIESGDRKPGKMLIHSAFKANGLKTVGDMLRALGLKYVVISGDENEQERTDNFLQFCDPNSGVDICLTSPAGGQGLDFRGIRTIFITEAQWNQATKNQIIGRGARRGSHDHLPLEDRTLDVYQLVLKYPGESLSADQCIAQHTEKKHNICSALLNKLKC